MLAILSFVVVCNWLVLLSSAADTCNEENCEVDPQNDLSYVVVPFGGAVQTVYNLNIVQQILNFENGQELQSSFNPNWGKMGIAYAVIYGIRNARLCIQHYHGKEESLINLINSDPINENRKVTSQQTMLREVQQWENELFSSFYHFNHQSNDINKWKHFITSIYDIYGPNNQINNKNNNNLRKYRLLFEKQSILDNSLPEYNDIISNYASKVPIFGQNSVNYGITTTKLSNENKDGKLNSKFILDKKSNKIHPSYKSSNYIGSKNIPNIVLNNGEIIPLIGFGSWPLVGQECYDTLMLAIKNGYRLIDTSQNYNNEEIIGKVIKDSITNGVIKDRSEIIIADKISFNQDFGNVTQQTRNAFMEQLRKLDTDYIDIYMIHGPIGDKERLKQAWYTMEELYYEGKIKTLAISNYNIWEFRELLNYARIIPSFLQTKFDIFTQGSQAPWVDNILPLTQEYNIFIQGYCIQNNWPGQLPAILDFHVKYMVRTRYKGYTETQLLLRWAYQYGITILTRSSNNERQIENIKIFDDNFKISDIDMQLLNGLITMYSPFRVSWMNDIYFLEKRAQ